ncbi:MAG: hypothetical protein JWO58_2362 [Chitinophagaceae bacterium]|nr:hypothetical protein [Chitinophagaceae bacterium]
MKKIIFLFSILMTLTVACSKEEKTLKDIKETPEQLTQQFEDGQAYLVDVRTPKEYKEGHLKYSTNIDFKSPDFKSEISKLDKSKPVYLYCKSGNRSKKATDTLQTLGFANAHSIGGFKALNKAGLPAE